jgi:hypothetical protein
MLTKQKIFSAVFLAMVGIGLFIGLPTLREFVLGKESETLKTSLPYDPAEKAAQEVAIVAAMKADTSRYERATDTRYIDSLPVSLVDLEAAFRNRNADRCERLLAGELLTNAEVYPVSPEANRTSNLKRVTTRQPVLSISLEVGADDQKSLPKMSKSQILRFLDSSWLSLQARFFLNTESNEWYLHYRPVAAQASFTDRLRTQAYESSVERTIEDVRGLGVFASSQKYKSDRFAVGQESASDPGVASKLSLDNSSSSKGGAAKIEKQTAAWLFRYDQQNSGAKTSSKEYEFIFVHIVPNSGNSNTDGVPWTTHLFCTTNQRQTLHYFSPESTKDTPQDPKDASLQAEVYFSRYGTGGLIPSHSVTRQIAIKSDRKYSIAELAKSIDAQEFKGGWQSNVPKLLDTIVGGL